MTRALTLTVALLLASSSRVAHADRVKDLASIQGVRTNALTGFGIVVGLDGTGDDARSPVVQRSLSKMLKGLGLTVDPSEFKSKNVAAVMVTATLAPFAHSGELLDVTVSSMGSAKSLAGGTLIATPLHGADGNTWAVAQGPLTVGGYTATGGSGSEVRKNHVTVGRIPDGGIIEGHAPTALPSQEIVLLLVRADFTTAQRMAAAIIAGLGPSLGDAAVRARDAGAVIVPIPAAYASRVPELIAALEAIEVEPDAIATIIIDERTGTIVVGEHVRLGPAAIAYGGLAVEITEQPEVSQPTAPLTKGSTTVVPHTDIAVHEEPGGLHALPGAATVGQVAAALDALGAKPRDLVAILQALAAAGALRARIEVL